jgi:osmotically inducible protein OsmC
MALAERSANVSWRGDLLTGSGELQLDSGAAPTLPVSWSARTEDANGRTSPEELLAGAQATCFAMAFSSNLAKAGHPAERLDVTASCTLDRVDGAATVTAMAIRVRGKVPGMDAETFTQVAEEAAQGCPIAKVLRGNLEESLEVEFDG